MKFFLSCDWGTSAFRLRLIEISTTAILSEIRTDHGISATYHSWKEKGKDEGGRAAFYQAYLLEQAAKIISSFNCSLDNTPLIISGMASSSIGMAELPYKKLPFHCDGSNLIAEQVPVAPQTLQTILMISGVRAENDVMRGEETMLAGCDIPADDREHLLIFPGTHSKHVTVKNGKAEALSTYMTGELFWLLTEKSILAASLKKPGTEHTAGDRHFSDGLIKGSSLNLLNGMFHVRTNGLFKKLTPEENFYYLSGLLIGNELKEIAQSKPGAITLVCSEGLKRQYMQGLRVLGLSDHLQYIDADEALIRGQWRIYSKLSLV